MKYNNLNSLLATLLLAVSMSQTAFALDWAEGKTVYFDNSVTQWSAVYVIIGKSGYNRAYQMEPVEVEEDGKITSLYKYTMSPRWEGYTNFVIASSVGGSSLGNNYTNINDAYATCSSRIDSVQRNVESDILICVTDNPSMSGTTSIYPKDVRKTFNIG